MKKIFVIAIVAMAMVACNNKQATGTSDKDAKEADKTELSADEQKYEELLNAYEKAADEYIAAMKTKDDDKIKAAFDACEAAKAPVWDIADKVKGAQQDRLNAIGDKLRKAAMNDLQ